MILQIVALFVSVLFTLAVIDFIRRNRLKERYALLWLAAGVAMIVLSAWHQLLIWVTGLFGFEVGKTVNPLVDSGGASVTAEAVTSGTAVTPPDPVETAVPVPSRRNHVSMVN